MGVSEQSFYRWKKKSLGMGVAELRRLRQLEEENRKLKGIVADLTLDKKMLQDVLSKKDLKPAPKRRLIRYLIGTYQVSERRACKVGGRRNSTRHIHAHRQSGRGKGSRMWRVHGR